MSIENRTSQILGHDVGCVFNESKVCEPECAESVAFRSRARSSAIEAAGDSVGSALHVASRARMSATNFVAFAGVSRMWEACHCANG